MLFKPVWRSLLLLNRREKSVFLLIVGLRVVVQALDLLGLAAIGVFGAMLASGLTGQTDAQFFGISVPVTDSQNFLWVSGVIAGFFLTKSVIGTALLRVTTLFLAHVEAAPRLKWPLISSRVSLPESGRCPKERFSGQ